ncbi:MAG: hypothetical protein JW990_18105 [Thermoleophilia bacterium]|nr:hypothetical protein [Thermoleophilia bacterium]
MRLLRVLKPAVRSALAAASRGRWAGEDLKDAAAVAALLRERGYDITLGYWRPESDTPGVVLHAYLDMLQAIPTLGGASYVSIKAPAFDADPVLYADLVQKSQALDVPVHFDSLGPDTADQVFALLAGSTPVTYERMGCTLPGRWRRSLRDADRWADSGLSIRVVKGEWPDPAEPRLDPAAGFFEVVQRLAGRTADVRVATHDAELALRSIELLRQAGTPCSLEVLYGFPLRRLLPRMAQTGVPIRVYVPFGRAWLPYCMWYTRTHPVFLWRLLRDSLGGPYPDSFPTICSPRAHG